MLKLGTKAPDFSAICTDGRAISLSALFGRKVVLFFFPKAFTSGCSLEVNMLQKKYPLLAERGIELIGISTDTHEVQCQFAAKENVSFPMIADSNKTICRSYGVLWPIVGISQRISYFIDETGHIRAASHHEVSITRHIEDILHWSII